MLIAILLVLAAGQVFAGQDTWTGVERVVAVGDVHGDFQAFTEVLRSAGVIDGKDHWKCGETHLVQAGDILDRGAESRKVMDLLISLEKEAEKAGGAVHSLIGNHEAMNVYGDLRYVTPGEFAAFRTADSTPVRERMWEQYARGLESRPGPDAKKKWEDEHPLGWFEHRAAFGPMGVYGKWLRSKNAIVKVNDSMYVHGGISAKFLSRNIRQINEEVAAELQDFSKLIPGSVAMAGDGPLWYRGLAQGRETELADHVSKLLQTYGVKRIVIAHTPTPGVVLPRFGGKVVMIDVGLSEVYGSRRACLLIEDNKLYAIHRGEKILLPSGGAMDTLRYLRQAEALEPNPGALRSFIRAFQASQGNRD